VTGRAFTDFSNRKMKATLLPGCTLQAKYCITLVFLKIQEVCSCLSRRHSE